jgi:hypothetical protein
MLYKHEGTALLAVLSIIVWIVSDSCDASQSRHDLDREHSSVKYDHIIQKTRSVLNSNDVYGFMIWID